VTTAAPICMVSAGGYHTILVDRDGAVFACGQNTHGQLGIGRIEYSVIVPELLEETEAGDELPPVHGTSTGTYHTLLLAKDGQVRVCVSFRPLLSYAHYAKRRSLSFQRLGFHG
jgi:alpha-tubulin suppressor-like RCC1 family protein